jgi:hypothetical protein
MTCIAYDKWIKVHFNEEQVFIETAFNLEPERNK